jgi:hypothetical protein
MHNPLSLDVAPAPPARALAAVEAELTAAPDEPRTWEVVAPGRARELPTLIAPLGRLAGRRLSAGGNGCSSRQARVRRPYVEPVWARRA